MEHKCISLIQTMYDGSESYVSVEQGHFVWLTVETAVSQGVVLSPIICSILLYFILRPIRGTVTQGALVLHRLTPTNRRH